MPPRPRPTLRRRRPAGEPPASLGVSRDRAQPVVVVNYRPVIAFVSVPIRPVPFRCRGPEAERRVRDEFERHTRRVGGGNGGRRSGDSEPLRLLGQQSPRIAHFVHFGLGEPAHGRVGAVHDPETAFAAAVNQMGRRPEAGGQLGVVVHCGQRGGCAPVPVTADQRVNAEVFAEADHAGGEHDQLPAIRDGHARAVDRLVAQPGRAELVGY